MKTLKSFRLIMAFVLAVLLAVPPVVLAQDSNAEVAKRFSQQELDQILAPVALYPDSLLAQVLMASTYPLEVVMADRWVKQNKNLTGDKLIEAADKEPWDPSVKALVPFSDLLSSMAEKLEWTEKVGDAFLAQQADVMETVQSLRKRAYEAGNLKSTNEQHVIVEKETILVEPADSRVVYVPVYDPWWVYGSWWWPYYPPYVFYPYPYASAFYYSGYIGFSAGFVVGAYWGNWGYCNWPYRTVYVNRHYYGRPYPGYRSAHVGSVAASRGAPTMQKWRHDSYHRRGVAYRDAAVGNQFGQARRTTADNRRVSRTFEDNMARRTGATKADAATRSGIAGNVGRTTDRSYPLTGRGGRPEASVSGTRPDRAGADRVIGSRSEGKTSQTIERSGRVETSSTPRNVTEQRGFGGRATERAYHPPSAQGGAPSAPAGVNRAVSVPNPVNRGRGESVSAPKAQNWNGVMGGQRSADSAFSRGGAVGAGDAFSRGGTGGHVGGGMGGGGFHRGR
jgi:hypothetical protein